jgi:hypothetical protein
MSAGSKTKIEGGNKRGHSNMAHRDHTEVIKSDTKKLRRRVGREIERKAKRGEIEDL